MIVYSSVCACPSDRYYRYPGVFLPVPSRLPNRDDGAGTSNSREPQFAESPLCQALCDSRASGSRSCRLRGL